MLKAGLLVFGVFYALSLVSAQQPHPLSELPPPGQITTGVFFSEHDGPVKHFPAGKIVKTVVGIHNDASETYNLTAIMGSLNSPTDFRIFVQNFTEQVYHRVVAGGSELSLEYNFRPDHRLEPRDFVVALTLFYHDKDGKYYSNTFFNSTVEIVEVKKLIDWELIFLFVFLGGLAAGIAYLAYGFVSPYLASIGMVKKGKKSRSAQSSKPDDADEWVKGSHYDNLKKKKAAATTKRS